MPIPAVAGYNERAWAIDVISEINLASTGRALPVRRAGGERSVKGAGSTLFPDVLLYGDTGSALIKQGWELKMPDTPINDLKLLKNAGEKAKRLDLNSFLVWNAQEAALHVLSEHTGRFEHFHAWPKTGLATRADVVANPAEWKGQLTSILADVNSFLSSGKLRGASPIAALTEQLFVDLIQRHTATYAASISTHASRSSSVLDEVDEWWENNQGEHAGSTSVEALARVNIVNWVNRFLFAHFLKSHAADAALVDSIDETVDPSQASEMFMTISRTCDFMNVFKPVPGQRQADVDTWGELVALNRLLTDSQLDKLPRAAFAEVLDKALAYSRKKLAGQFATPAPLAELLVRLTIEDSSKHVIDPCCGTGTIAKAAYDFKRELRNSAADAMSTTWASDKFSFPLQLSTIALSDPEAMFNIVRVFQHDALTLSTGERLSFTDPVSGSEVFDALPRVHAVVSNLPFIRFENYKRLNPLPASLVEANAEAEEALGGKSDFYAYLVLQLGSLLEEGGRVGVIVSNSWMSTAFGEKFRKLLLRRYRLLYVVQSGKGRWFSNAKVVTNLLVLEKRGGATSLCSEKVSFVSVLNDINDWQMGDGGVRGLARAVRRGNPKLVRRAEYESNAFASFEALGVTWSALFADLTWMSTVKEHLVSLGGLFHIRRGLKSECNDLFYPEGDHGIEPDYLRPLVKGPKDVDTLRAAPAKEVFICSKSLQELADAGHSGAISWIRRFEAATNGKGILWPVKLRKNERHWYELAPSSLTGLLVAAHPNRRLGFHLLSSAAVVDQCFVPMTPKADAIVDVELCHALLSSTLGLFMLEAAGFGRGQGVLDLNGEKLGALQVLDPASISAEQRTVIMHAFSPLRDRSVLDLDLEVGMDDRRALDLAVMTPFGLEGFIDAIRSALLHLYEMRVSVRP